MQNIKPTHFLAAPDHPSAVSDTWTVSLELPPRLYCQASRKQNTLPMSRALSRPPSQGTRSKTF